jgi:hypothetical protein
MTSELTLRRLAAAAIAVVGVIHLVLSPEYLDEQTYIGVLFIAGGLGALFVAIRLWMIQDRAAGSLGALIAAGMFIGFVLSRTTGLPGFKEAEWELSGIVSLILEAGFIGLWLASMRAAVPVAAERRAARPTTRRGGAGATTARAMAGAGQRR